MWCGVVLCVKGVPTGSVEWCEVVRDEGGDIYEA